MSVARVSQIPINFDGSRLATVEINRGSLTFSVRLYKRRRLYTLPLSMVAEMVAWKILKAEVLEKKAAKRAARRKS
jgi:hypothetical protein